MHHYSQPIWLPNGKKKFTLVLSKHSRPSQAIRISREFIKCCRRSLTENTYNKYQLRMATTYSTSAQMPKTSISLQNYQDEKCTKLNVDELKVRWKREYLQTYTITVVKKSYHNDIYYHLTLKYKIQCSKPMASFGLFYG